jgi:hypothetical protein
MNAFLSIVLLSSSLLMSLSGQMAVAANGSDAQHSHNRSADMLSGVHPAKNGVSAPAAGCTVPATEAARVTKTPEERRNDMLRALISKHQLATGKVAAFNPVRSLTPGCRSMHHNEDS